MRAISRLAVVSRVLQAVADLWWKTEQAPARAQWRGRVIESLEPRCLLTTITGGDSGCAWYLRRDPINGEVELYDGGSAAGQLIYHGTELITAITGGAGDDVLTVDFANGNPVGASGLTFDGAGGANALIVRGTNGDDTFTVTSNTVQVGSGVITFQNAGEVDLDGRQGTDSVTASGPLNLRRLSSFSNVSYSNVNVLAEPHTPVSGESAGSAWYLRRNPNNAMKVQLYNGDSADGQLIYDGYAPVTSVSGAGVDDHITVDFTYGSPIYPVGLTFDGGGGSNAIILKGTSGNDPFTMTESYVQLRASVITYTNMAEIDVNGMGGADSVSVVRGTVNLRDLSTLSHSTSGTGYINPLPAPLPPIVGGDSGNSWYLRRASPSGPVELYSGEVPLGQPYSPSAPIISIVGGAGSDILTVDFSNGSPIAPLGLSFDGAGGNNVLIVKGKTGDDAFTATDKYMQLGAGLITYSHVGVIDVDGVSGADTLGAPSGIVNLGELSGISNTTSGSGSINLLDNPRVDVTVAGPGAADVGAHPQFTAILNSSGIVAALGVPRYVWVVTKDGNPNPYAVSYASTFNPELQGIGTYLVQVTTTDDLGHRGNGAASLRVFDEPKLWIDRPQVAAPPGNATFAVRLTKAVMSQTVTVDWKTVDGTAVADTDYYSARGTLEFPPGTTERTISVQLKSDGYFDPAPRRFTVVLGNWQGADVAVQRSTASIPEITQQPANTTFVVQAVVDPVAPEVTLRWPETTGAYPYLIYRKRAQDGSWTQVATLSRAAEGWVDYLADDPELDSVYDYRITALGGGVDRQLRVGRASLEQIQADRGTVVLIVDRGVIDPSLTDPDTGHPCVTAEEAAGVSARLLRLEHDLIDDGWSVIRHDFEIEDRQWWNADVRYHDQGNDLQPEQFERAKWEQDRDWAISDLIWDDYSATGGNVRSVLLFGHLPVPYSGNIAPDNHVFPLTNYTQGAWPTDLFYADARSNEVKDDYWTDSIVSTSRSQPSVWGHFNYPGDGRFDIPVPNDENPDDGNDYAEEKNLIAPNISIGRVDLSRISAFLDEQGLPKREGPLLADYLDRDHAFRRGELTAGARGLVHQSPNSLMSVDDFSQLLTSRNAGYGEWFTSLASQSYLFGYYGQRGADVDEGDDFGTSDFAGNMNSAVFNGTYGSYFGDFNARDSFTRAPLGTNWGLVSIFGRAGDPFASMGMGETVGESVRQAEAYPSFYFARPSSIAAIMGDPTLRMSYVAPPASLRGQAAPGGGVLLTWDASPDAFAKDIIGYYVYRATYDADPAKEIFERRSVGGTALVQGTSFTDADAAIGQYVYMVRAVRLDDTPTGSYVNVSEGITDEYIYDLPGTYDVYQDLGSNARVIVNGQEVILNFGVTEHLASLSITDGLVTLVAGGDKLLVTQGLSISGTGGGMGKLDLYDNDMILQSTEAGVDAALGDMTGWIITGRNGGSWNGNGIRSTTASQDSSGNTGLAMARNVAWAFRNGVYAPSESPFITSFVGETVDIYAILVKYTWQGDASFDGMINADDYGRIDRGFIARGSVYDDGDFNYDGLVNADDYGIIDRGFVGQNGRLGAQGGGGFADTVSGDGTVDAIDATGGGGMLLDNPQFLEGLTIDLRDHATGGKSVQITTVGQVVTIDVYAVVVGTKSWRRQGLDIVMGSFVSANIGQGAALGDLLAAVSENFQGTAGDGGLQQDLDGDGDLDVGSNDAELADGHFVARAGAVVYGPLGLQAEFLIGTLTFTVTQLGAIGGETDINFVKREGKMEGALWVEDYSVTTGMRDGLSPDYRSGAPVVLTKA